MNLTIGNNVTSILYNGNPVSELVFNGHSVWKATSEPDYANIPMTFEILTSGTIDLVITGSSTVSDKVNKYKINGGTEQSITNTGSINVSAGDIVTWTQIDTRQNNNTHISIQCTCTCNIYGNLTLSHSTLTTNFELRDLFNGNTGIISAEHLILHDTLYYGCYRGMFYGCTSLTKAPALPALTLANYCYYEMFANCTSLTTAPDLLAQTLVTSCYYQLFYNCSNLNYIKCMAKYNITISNCNYWVYGVASSGTMYIAYNTQWSSGTSGKPASWTILIASS